MIFIGKFQDLTGQKFGKLTVIEQVRKPTNNQLAWLCQCDCGNTHITISYSLTHGLCKSCGCIGDGIANYNKQRKEIRKNIYSLDGEYGIGYTYKKEMFYFDLEDYDQIKDYQWSINNQGYVISKEINNNKKTIFMHRLVMGVKDRNILVDHIYHNKADNRKSQLRLVNPQQNSANNIAIRKNNTSGHKGVYWHEPAQKWEVLIQYDNHLYNLGLYANIEDAVEARKKAELKYFGEYRYRENPELMTDT